MSTQKEIAQQQYEASKLKNGNLTTVNFQQNWNNKLYGKYFTTIRKTEHPIRKGDLCDIVLNGKGVKIARCIYSEIIKFHEIGETIVMCDTGFNYAESLALFKKFGIDVSSFETEVRYSVFCSE